VGGVLDYSGFPRRCSGLRVCAVVVSAGSNGGVRLYSPAAIPAAWLIILFAVVFVRY
jgi:hypothetical protein